VEYVSRWIAQLQQRYTQRGGVRPFGVTSLVAGFDISHGSVAIPQLYKTEPSGTYSAWKAACTGKNSKLVREYLEKKFKDDMSKDDAIGLAIEALLEVVDSGKGNIEVVVLSSPNAVAEFLDEDRIDVIVKEVERKKEEEAERKKREAQQG